MAIDRTTGPALRQTPLTPSANEAVFGGTLRRPPRLLLNQGATRVQRQNEHLKRDELWQGDAYDPLLPDEPDIPIYFRLASANTAVAELVCSVMAQALGLPTPQPYVLEIPAATLPQSRFHNSGQLRICVATQDIGGASFGQLLQENSDHAKQMLRRWALLVPVAAFDEWAANADRSYGNILYVAQTLWLIDHAEALCGSSRALFPLADLAHDPFTNTLALFLTEGNAAVRQKYLEQAQQWIVFSAGALDIDALALTLQLGHWHTVAEEQELVDFLKTRRNVTHHLLCQRLGHPQFNLSRGA